MLQDLRTPSEVKQAFVDKGETITAWAKAHGFSRNEVYAVLNGKTKGRHGNSHRIAVLLGIKADPARQKTPDLSSAAKEGSNSARTQRKKEPRAERRESAITEQGESE